MLAYHNDKAIKAKYVNRMKAHIAADELVRGVGFENGRGCAVGCTLNKYDHKAFEAELGIPEWLARLLDTLHENTGDKVWPTFSLKFLRAIKPGQNLEPIKHHISLFILRRNRERVDGLEISASLKSQVIAATDECIACHTDSLTGVIEPARWSAAARSAESAESAAESAAWSAAWSAGWSAAESAWSAAGSAARSAGWSAAESAESAAEYDAIANELLRLIREAA